MEIKEKNKDEIEKFWYSKKKLIMPTYSRAVMSIKKIKKND